ncbi:MAG: hypothetical protein ACRCYQ_09100 [Nocardioides sp.]
MGEVRARDLTRPPSGLWAVLVVVVTVSYTSIPYLLDPRFYQRGDTAVQFAPTWFHLGTLVRDGQWPVWLDPDAWAGGNYAVEALHGIYNPLNPLIWVFMSRGGDLELSTFGVKVTVMTLLALGCYLLTREYGAVPWASAVVATAVPFSGFTLYWDAGAWPSGLIAFTYLPWVWLSWRRCLRRATSPWWAFAVGALAVTHGNPYGALGVIIVGAGLVAEGFWTRRWSGLAVLVGVGLCVALVLPLVYLPLLLTADVTYRSGGSMAANYGTLKPAIGDFLGVSSVLSVPSIEGITGPVQVPAMYLTWLLMPLLPWLRFDVLRRRRKELVGIAVVSGVYLVLSTGPSHLWMFRWPLRLVEYCYLGLAVAFAVVLSQGLQRTRWRRRLAATVGLIGAGGYLDWSADPDELRRIGAGVALALVLTALVLCAHWRRTGTTVLAVLCVLGTGAVLTTQVSVLAPPETARLWNVPGDVDTLRRDFGDRESVLLQFADLEALREREGESAWADFLPGSMYQVAGVKAVGSYTGVGFTAFNERLCMGKNGSTEVCGYRQVWRPIGPGQPPLIDAMKVRTIVVENSLLSSARPDASWKVVRVTERATILRRADDLPWPGSRLSWASSGVEVTGARTVQGPEEAVRLHAPDGGTLVFATLGWPGWHASIDGEPIAASAGPTGLLTVTVPPGSAGTLRVGYRPPGLVAGLACAVLGLAGALTLGAAAARTRSRTPRQRGLG